MGSAWYDSYSTAAGSRPYQTAATVIVVLTTLLALLYRSLFTIRYPANLPRLGADRGVKWRDMKKLFQTDCLAVFNDAYDNYSKKGRAVLIPVFGPGEEVVLPPSSLTWLCRQPDHVASSLHAQIDAIGLDHSLGAKFAHDPWGGMLIKNDLNSALEAVCAVMNDEVGAAVDDCFGRDADEWRELELFPACRLVAGRATLAFTLGDSPEGRRLCRDEGFVQSCYGVLDGMLDTAGTLAATPKFLKRLHGPWASRAMRAKLADLARRFEPLHRERLRIIEKQQQQTAGGEERRPRDLLQMMLEYAVRERPAEARSLDDMTRRLAVSNFGTMHQTVLTLHNLLLDVTGSDAEFGTIAALREEVARVITGAAGDGKGEGEVDPARTNARPWTRAQVAALVRADSAARETMRVHSFIGRTVQRLIIAPSGLTTEDGVHLSRGTTVSILAHQAQTDPDAHADPLKYDPFRFSRAREAAAAATTSSTSATSAADAAATDDKKTTTTTTTMKPLSFASTGADYLPFSHGRHACPGRFLADFELKMVLARALAGHDVALLPAATATGRPPNVWFAGFGIPPLDAKIRVRRRRVKGE
ncbi:cytochrome P450 [Xylariaceae sp. FL0804]|nr:cytochrome P450 [Xylariaceae sp. FL0804]